MPTENYGWEYLQEGDAEYPVSHSALVDEIDGEINRVEQAFAGHDHSGGTLGTEAEPVTEAHIGSVDTDEVSVTYNDAPARTEQVIYRAEDMDNTTALSFDTGSFGTTYGRLIVIADIDGYGGGTHAPVRLRVDNNTTSTYAYNYISSGSFGSETSTEGFGDEIFNSWSASMEWMLTGTGRSRGPMISGRSATHFGSKRIISGHLSDASTVTVDSVQVSTAFPATATFVVMGEDY